MEKICNGIWKITLGEPEKFTPMKLMNFNCNKEKLNHFTYCENFIFGKEEFKDIKYKKTKRGISFELPIDVSEDIYGFGLQFHSFNQSGRKRYLRVNSDPVADTGESHAPVPFYVSTKGYGLFVDTFRYASFYMGTSAHNGASKEMKESKKVHEEFSENALYALKKAKEPRMIIVDIPVANGVDLYFFAGPDIKTAVMRYNLFSGGGCLPPMWGLGMWYRAYGGSNQNHILKLASDFRKDGMPMDVIGLEPGWHTHSYSCSYKWNDELFKNHQEMIDILNELGYKINLWEHVFVHPSADIYDDLVELSGNYEVWNGLVPDFSIAKAKNIFKKHHKEKFVDNGIMGFKLDECDNSDYNPSCWSFPNCAEFPSGMDGEQMHSAIGLLYQEAIFEAFKESNKRTLSQVRSSWALASSLPFVLYSDLYDHKEFIRGIVNSGFSGLLWAPEVRGCENTDDLIRRLQTVVFSHHALLNCWRIPNPPWIQVNTEKNLKGEIQENSKCIAEICKKYFELRMSLIPYFYSAFAKYFLTGLPPIRALVMDFENDVNTRLIDDQYMFGENLLVCPMTLKDGNHRSIYLPNGIWYDFWTNEKHEGGKRFEFSADIDKIPVFVKDNSIIPFAKPVQFINTYTVFELNINCYGNGRKEFDLYEDDGISFDYENGVYKFIKLYANEKDEYGMIETGNCACHRYVIDKWNFIL